MAEFGWNDWADIKPSEVPVLFLMMQNVKPDVAKKAIDVILSIPELAGELKEFFQTVMDCGFQSNADVMKAINDADRAIINGFRKQLERDDLSKEER